MSAEERRSGSVARLFVEQTRTRHHEKPPLQHSVESLQAMRGGCTVKSDAFFHWPRWVVRPSSSLAAPTRAMLQGMDSRGVVAVEKRGLAWITRINPAGVKAIEEYAVAKRKTIAVPNAALLLGTVPSLKESQ